MRLPILILLAACCGAADLQSLFDRGMLFDLRDAVAGDPHAPAVFRAAVACAFNEEGACLSESKAILNSHPLREVADHVYDVLGDFHYARGRWSDVLADLDAQVAAVGEFEGAAEDRAVLRALLKHGDVAVVRAEHSSIHVLYKNAHVPFEANGRSYHGYVDTGANISLLSESAARQLGLPIENVDVRMGDASGKGIHIRQVAVADRFNIGDIELRNVPFLIVSDRQQPFAGWGAGKRCVIGIQVLLAARNMTWRTSFPGVSYLELARPAGVCDRRAADLCLHNKMPLAAVEYRGKRQTLMIDTGMGKTILRSAFATHFPELIYRSVHFRFGLEGVGGSASAQGVLLPEIALRAGGADVVFRRLPVYLKGPAADRYDGMFGNDLTGKAREFTLDFEAMRLTLR